MINRPLLGALIGGVLVVAGWIGYRSYLFYTHDQIPIIALHGLVDRGYVSKTVTGSVEVTSGYKVRTVSMTLDGKPLVENISKFFPSAHANVPFMLDTLALNRGKHTIVVHAVDGSFRKNAADLVCDFYIDNAPLDAAFLNSEYRVLQGRTIHATINASKELESATVTFLSKKYPCCRVSDYSTQYECFIPVDCEQQPQEHTLTANLVDHVQNSMTTETKVVVEAYQFPKQKGLHVAQEKLDEERDVSMNNKVLEEALEKWVADSLPYKLWNGPFEMPTEVRKISTPYGEVRTTPERGRYMHKAVDIVNTPRSVVCASQSGKVIIRDRFLMTGNTVVMDHGLGVQTLYAHLEDFGEIEVGDMIKKGARIGRLGKTGYATGYHLHFELRVQNVQVDPVEWTRRDF